MFTNIRIPAFGFFQNVWLHTVGFVFGRRIKGVVNGEGYIDILYYRRNFYVFKFNLCGREYQVTPHHAESGNQLKLDF